MLWFGRHYSRYVLFNRLRWVVNYYCSSTAAAIPPLQARAAG